jgi:hypothetical protein
MTLDEFLDKYIDGYLLEDLRSMVEKVTVPRRWSAARIARVSLPLGDDPATPFGVADIPAIHCRRRGLHRLICSIGHSQTHCFDDGTSCRPSATAPCIGEIVTPAAASCRHTSKFSSLLNVPAVFRCSVLHTWS